MFTPSGPINGNAVSSVGATISDDEYRDRLRWHLQRGEAWIGNADTKATIALALNAAVIAVVTAIVTLAGTSAVSLVNKNILTVVLAIGFALALLVSVSTAAFAIMPSIGRRNSPGESSLYHFAVVAEEGNVDGFRTRYRALSSAGDLATLENMVWVNARVSTTKFWKLQWSVAGLVGALVFGMGLVMAVFLS